MKNKKPARRPSLAVTAEGFELDSCVSALPSGRFHRPGGFIMPKPGTEDKPEAVKILGLFL
jgi:hypothetical protein